MGKSKKGGCDSKEESSNGIEYEGAKGGAMTLDLKGKSPEFYIKAIFIVAIVIGILYYSYTCFCENQSLSLTEPYTEKTEKSGIDDDNAFDVDSEINKLRELQEKYLTILKK